MQRIGKKSFAKAKGKLLCFLLSMALVLTNLVLMPVLSVSAAEPTEEGNGSQETLQPQVIVRNYEDLIQAIDEAEDGDVIGITGEILFNDVNCTVGEENKNITIVRMNESSYIRMYGENTTVRFKNLIFDGVSEKYKKTMSFMQASGHLELTHCTFQNCNSEFGGAAIFFESGEANIDRCIFKNNEGGEAPHIYLGNSTAKVTNSSFYNGYSHGNAGAISIYTEGFISLNDCQIYNNTAERYGGGIYNQGTVKLSNTIIYGNIAKEGADILNGDASSFEMETLDELAELYIANRIAAERWDYSHGNENYLVLSVLGDTATGNGTMRLVYNKISDSVDDSEDNNGSENGESKGDAIEPEQPKDDSNKENDNKDDSTGDNKDNAENKNGNNIDDAIVSDNDNIGNSDSEQDKPVEGTADDFGSKTDNNKENQDNQNDIGHTGNNENEDGNNSDLDDKDSENSNTHTPDTSAGNDNQTSNPNLEKPNTGNSGNNSVSDSKPEGNNSDSGIVGNENQSNSSVDGSSNNNTNQNQTNTPVSGATNNSIKDNVSGNNNSSSGNGTGNSNINTAVNTSQSGENASPKPEDNQDNNSGSSNNGGTAAITDNTQTAVSNNNNGSSDKENTVTKKKIIKKLSVSAKSGKRKAVGKTIKKATVKVKIGKKIYKGKSDAKGRFTVKLKGKTKLKKGQKIKVTVIKKGYKTKIKTFKVK